MKKRKLLMMLIMLMYLSIQAQSKFVLKSQNSKISGTSTIHDWKINVTKFSGNSSIVFESNNLKVIKAFDIQIAGKDLKSEKGSKDMDEKMYEALKIPTNPTINFKLNKITALPTSANGHTLSATGAFTIGGFSKCFSQPLKGESIDWKIGHNVLDLNKVILLGNLGILYLKINISRRYCLSKIRFMPGRL